MAQGSDTQTAPQHLESAEMQVTMLTALLRRARTDDEGMVMVNRDHVIEALERIQEDHRRQLQGLPVIAERLMSCFGITA